MQQKRPGPFGTEGSAPEEIDSVWRITLRALRPPGEAVYFAAAARACLRLAREVFHPLHSETAVTTAIRMGAVCSAPTCGGREGWFLYHAGHIRALRRIRRGSAPAYGSHTVICPPRCCGPQDTWPPGSAEPGGRTSATVQR